MNAGQRLSDGLTVAGALLAFAFGAYLLIVGPELTTVTPEGFTMTARSPSPAGLVPLAIGILAVWAMSTRRARSSWLAAGVAIAAAVMFLFSISVQLAAIAAVLVLAAAIRTIASRATAGR